MAETVEKEHGFIGQIRRLSRRLSGNVLSADVKDIRAYMVRNENKRNIYSYDNEDNLRIGGILLKDLGEEFGTPLYIYDIKRIYDNFNLYSGSLKNKNFLLGYSVKANTNLAILNILSRLGAGFDAASGGEIARCLAAGIDPTRITFSGCGKTQDEIELAVKSGIHCINAESWEELDRIEIIASKYNKTQNVAIRVNSDLNQDNPNQAHHQNILPGTINQKFGVPISDALDIYSRVKASSTLRIKGISCYIGPHITQLDTYLDIRDKLLHLADELRQESRICVEHINFGGEYIGYLNGASSDGSEISHWLEKIANPIMERGLKFVFEPGPGFLADCGVLLTKIEYIKHTSKEASAGSGTTSPKSGSLIGSAGSHMKNMFTKRTYAIVDAGFNDFPQTAFFNHQHNIIPVVNQHSVNTQPTEFKYDIVGPISEINDVFHKDIVFHQKLHVGDYLIIPDAGSYGSSMASNFMARNKPAEVIITDRTPIVIREREKYEEQFAREKVIPEMKLKSAQILEDPDENQEEMNNKSE